MLKGLCWTCLLTNSGSWWLLLKFWHVRDGARKCCCNPQCSDVVCWESGAFSVIEGVYLLTCFILNYTLNSHAPVLLRLFYSSQTLPGGGGVFFFFFSPHLSFLFYFSGWAVQTLWDFEIRHVNPLQMFLQRNNSCAGWCGCVFPLIITVSLHTNLCFICGLCNFLKKQTTKHMYSSRQLLQEDEANVFLPSSLSTWQGRVLLLALNQACGIW